MANGGKNGNLTPEAKTICNQITIVQIWLFLALPPPFFVWPLLLQKCCGWTSLHESRVLGSSQGCWLGVLKTGLRNLSEEQSLRRSKDHVLDSVASGAFRGGLCSCLVMLLFPCPIFLQYIIWQECRLVNGSLKYKHWSDFSWKFGLGWQNIENWFTSNYLVTKSDFII